jgi:cytidine deaminase
MTPVDFDALLAAAQRVAQAAYSPYSEIRVGAALLDDQGQVHLGCNVESASYGATICAERAALVSAVAAGRRSFRALAIWASPQARLMPCGICRQVLVEFAPDLELVVASSGAEPARYNLAELLPGAVRPEHLR